MPQNKMDRIWKIIIELGETDAQPIANFCGVMIAVMGLLFSLQLVVSSQPYHYFVQCKSPVNIESKILVASRETGLKTEGPVPDATGKAAITSNKQFENYDITLDNNPCEYAGNK